MKWKPDCITYAFISTLGRRALFNGSSCYQVAHINSEGNSKWTIFSGGRTSVEFFCCCHATARHETDTEDLCFHQLCLEQLKLMLPLAVWENEQNNIFVIAVFMRLWKGYVCAAPFHKTYLQSQMDPTRDLFMAESHPSVPLHRCTFTLKGPLLSILLLWLCTEKKKICTAFCLEILNIDPAIRQHFIPKGLKPPAK